MNKDIRDSFFDQIYEMACKDKNIIFISADADAFSLRQFKQNLPDQFINVGVAEQNMALVATGLALEGKRVFIYSITSFTTPLILTGQMITGFQESWKILWWMILLTNINPLKL